MSVWLLPLIEVLEVPPDLLHIRLGGVGRPHRRVLIPQFQYGIRFGVIFPSRGRLQTRPDLCCCLLRLSPGVCHEGPMEGYGDTPRHAAAFARVLLHGRTLIYQPDEVWGYPEVERGAFQFGGGAVPRS